MEVDMGKFDRLIKKVDFLNNEISQKMAKAGMAAAGNVIRKAAIAKVPVRTGALRDCISRKVGKRKAGGEFFAKVYTKKPKKGADPEKDPRRYAHLVEFGTVKTAPQPFLVPALHESAGAAVDAAAKRAQKVFDKEFK